MKVLVWTQYFWPENFHINQVVTELRNQGMDVTILTGKPNYPDGNVFAGYRAKGIQTELRDGVEIIRLPLTPRGKNSAKGLMLNYLSFIAAGYIFGPWVLRGRHFDVIFVYAPSPLLQALPAIFVSWIKRAPLVLWVQDLWPESLRATGYINNHHMLKLVEWVIRYIYRFSDSILIQSEGFRESVQRLTRDMAKIKFFPNSARLSTPIDVQSTLTFDHVSRYFSVVFAGNIGIAQSCSTIIEAADALQDYKEVRFFIVGSGSMEQMIARMIKDKQLRNVELVGRVPPEQISKIYAMSSVLLLTLRDDPVLASTIPSKLQSYLAAGKPIIASCHGQAAQVLADAEAGLSCAPEDSLGLAEAVLELYRSDPLRLQHMGENGQKFFLKNFNLPTKVAQLIEHFSDVVKGFRR
ncbi:glycosyltransferase family 4 protein [Pseudomonas sp. V98_8]|jgi:glycosyltransferase involved in cell wall biosynthesis|uniref:glycosyltransferase family 4 protein n=1 Tax=Pseudomonas sp. V98_8 TaxID=3044228 RepID=UPI00249E174D|nr:glycosyltransferase family 4 protein [Pseudomonas sp. V98_8]MDI3394700.1 glycosyltransferase family 4 protein [Pseudomonas sp. V98_8]